MTENPSEPPGLPRWRPWLAIAGALAVGMVLYGLLVPLFASIITRVASPVPESIPIWSIVHTLTAWILPALVMFGVGIAAGRVFEIISLEAGLAAGFGAAVVRVWSTLSLPAEVLSSLPDAAQFSIIGECVLLMAAGLFGGLLARRLETRDEDPRPGKSGAE